AEQRTKSDSTGRVGNALCRISDEIGVRAGTYTVANTCIVAGDAACSTVVDGERSAGLNGRDSRPLPASQERTLQPRRLEEGQVINVTHGEDLSLIKVGTGAVAGEIVGVNKAGVATGRDIVDRMTPGIGQAQLQRAYRLAQ